MQAKTSSLGNKQTNKQTSRKSKTRGSATYRSRWTRPKSLSAEDPAQPRSGHVVHLAQDTNNTYNVARDNVAFFKINNSSQQESK